MIEKTARSTLSTLRRGALPCRKSDFRKPAEDLPPCLFSRSNLADLNLLFNPGKHFVKDFAQPSGRLETQKLRSLARVRRAFLNVVFVRGVGNVAKGFAAAVNLH